MLYQLFTYLDKTYDLAGAGLFQFITFRAAMATLVSLLITLVFGKRLIGMLQRKQVGEDIRDLGLEGQMEKKGTPTMGGIIIILAIVVPVLLFADLSNLYIILLLVTCVGLGLIGFLDDYIKVFLKDKKGLHGRFKIVGQVGIGLVVGLGMSFYAGDSTLTTIPFFKNNEFDYNWLVPFLSADYTWVIYTLVIIFIITAVSNGANITDGIDGLAAGTSAIIGLTLATFAYLSGNAIFADYLNIMFLPGSGEVMIFATAFVGGCVGFLWYNSNPAQVFMGDTGSLSLGGTIAVLAIVVRKELILPVLCGVFLVENLSVILQVAYFKYTKKKYGEGRRIFLMSPLHHHYQKKGLAEPKIVTRFWIVGILLAVVSLATLKVR